MQTDTEAPQLTTEQLIAILGDDINTLIEEVMNAQYLAERRIYINRAKRNWRFVKGDHFLAPGFVDDGDGEYVDYVSVDGSSEDAGANQKFAYAINVIGGDCWKYVAVTGQSAPNVKCVPDDLDDQQAIDEAKKADISAADFRAKWDADQKQREMAFHQYVTGPIFGLTRYVTNKRKYGVTRVPKFSIEIILAPDGMTPIPIPVPDGEEVYENGDAELHLANVLQVSVPFGKKTIEECKWLDYQYLESKYTLLGLYRKQLQEHRNDDSSGASKTSSDNTALEAQDATANPSGAGNAAKKGDWLFRQTWLDPEVLEGISNEERRELAKQYFPEGLRAVKVNDKLVDLNDEDKNKVWSVCKTGRGEYILENPICEDSIPFQKAIDDMFGLAIETILRAIPKTIVDQALISRQSLLENEATPAEVVLTLGNHGGDISKGIAALPMARFSDQLAPFVSLIREWQQDVTNIRPEITGGGEPSNTYREAKQRKDQAMLALSPAANEHGKFWERAYQNGNRQRAKFGTGEIKVQKQGSFGVTTDVTDMSELSETMWHCEADEGVPMSFTERADRLLAILKEYPPEVIAQLQVTDLVNIGQVLALLQLSGFKSPIDDAYRKAVKIIGLCAQEEPIMIPGPVDYMTGQPLGPPQVQSSRPIDDIEEDPQFFLQVAQRWMNSPEGEKVKEKNQAGYENVKARAREARQMVQMAMMAAAPPPEEGGDKPKGKGDAPKEAPAEPLSPTPLETPAPTMAIQ